MEWQFDTRSCSIPIGIVAVRTTQCEQRQNVIDIIELSIDKHFKFHILSTYNP
jgi:hypothetical protein